MTRKRRFSLLTLLWLLASVSLMKAQELKVEKGFDLFRTLPDFESVQSFIDCPVPGLTFETHSTSVLTGCASFDGDIRLQGSPLETFRGVTVGAVDTIVERKSTLDFGMPTESMTLTTPIELVALNLVSVAPVQIQCDQGPTRWRVQVEVDSTTGSSQGQMAVTLNHPALTGGKAASNLDVCPRVTFTRVDPGGSGSFVIYPCDLLCGPQLVGETAWSFTPPPGSTEVLKIDGLTTPNFFFADPPSSMLSSQFKSLAKAAGVAATPLECECGFRYPHLSPTHTHQACSPCPCDADIVAPTLRTPSTPESPLECTGKNASGEGGISASDPFVATWLSSAVCDDVTSPIRFCGPVNPPSFFRLGPPENPPAHCVGTTTVNFRAEDKCGNRTNRSVPLRVQDTRGAVVTSGDGTFDCLTPPAGGVQCYFQNPDPPISDNPFDFETIRQSFTSDLCSEVADWWFVDCASDQPDDVRADGNTTGDCVVAPDRRSFCVRAERAGGIEGGRHYSVKIQAKDECGNTGDPAVIGFIHVPLELPPGDTCTEVPPCRPECSAEPTAGEVPLAVNFSSKSNCPVESWTWDFGDGGTSQDPMATSHTYSAPSTYAPKLTVKFTGFDSPVTVACPAITVAPRPPVAACSVTPASGTAPLAVTGTDQSTAGTSPITSWSWDFGDGNTSSSQNTSHTYASPGTYTVTLTVSDGTLTSTANCGTVVVNAPPPPPCIPSTCLLRLDGVAPNGQDKIYINLANRLGCTSHTFNVTQICQDEEVSENPRDRNVPDGALLDPVQQLPWVRAERHDSANNKSGRVYHLTFEASPGPTPCGGVVTVCIPHDQGKEESDDCTGGAVWDSTKEGNVSCPTP